jgi:Fur family peroxide stress response transcriptional regulator
MILNIQDGPPNDDALERRLAQWTAAVKASGVKLTHQRLEIFRELAANEEHPDVETVFRAVRARVPTVSIDTVYRTLWLLHELGLITTLGPRREGIRFDVNLERHHHFVCVRCGVVRDFVSDALCDLPLPSGLSGLGDVLDARVEVRGVCASCRTSDSEASDSEASDRAEQTPAQE